MKIIWLIYIICILAHFPIKHQNVSSQKVNQFGKSDNIVKMLPNLENEFRKPCFYFSFLPHQILNFLLKFDSSQKKLETISGLKMHRMWVKQVTSKVTPDLSCVEWFHTYVYIYVDHLYVCIFVFLLFQGLVAYANFLPKVENFYL
jgi:hypothetical protein